MLYYNSSEWNVIKFFMYIPGQLQTSFLMNRHGDDFEMSIHFKCSLLKFDVIQRDK